MTVKIERNYSIRNTRAFLQTLLDPKKTPRVPRKIRREAYWCLRHFPSDFDINRLPKNDVFDKLEKKDEDGRD